MPDAEIYTKIVSSPYHVGNVYMAYAPCRVDFSMLNPINVETQTWDFGDGTGSTEESPVHTYNKGGIYSVTLQVGNSYGKTIRNWKIEVEDVPNAVRIDSIYCFAGADLSEYYVTIGEYSTEKYIRTSSSSKLSHLFRLNPAWHLKNMTASYRIKVMSKNETVGSFDCTFYKGSSTGLPPMGSKQTFYGGRVNLTVYYSFVKV